MHNEINKLDREKPWGAMIRSKVRWVQEVGHGTKYFLQLEKANAKAKTMSAVRLDNGTVTRNSQIILNQQIKYYEKLYTKDKGVRFEHLGDHDVKFTNMQKKQMDLPLQKDELPQALKCMKQNKTPGPDGLSTDFYMMFWSRISDTMYNAFIDSFQKKRLFFSARRGIIALILKKNKDIFLVRNWHPICLLNVDYKILSKALACRLKPNLLTVVNEDQTGFMAGRNISQNVRMALDIMHYTEIRQIETILISVDFEKAFDRVDYSSMYDILKVLGVGPEYLKWIELLFTDFQLATSNAGFVSRFIIPGHGLFQGNPIASLLFTLVIEVLAQMLRNNDKIDVVEIQGIKYILSQFADDLNIFRKFNAKSLNAILDTLKLYERISGMKVSMEKTTIYRIGSISGSNARLYTQHKIAWCDKPINLLGIQVMHQFEQLAELNYAELMEKANRILCLWKNRDLLLMAKIQVVNSLVFSIFMHRMNVNDLLPQSLIRTFNQIVKNFIWNGKTAKISTEILSANKADGGLGLVNIELKDKASKVAWVYLINKNEKLKKLAYELLENKIHDLIWQIELECDDIEHCFKVEGFWMDVFKTWCQFRANSARTKVPGQSIIWYNSRIRINNFSGIHGLKQESLE